jgi:hypothetical protein
MLPLPNSMMFLLKFQKAIDTALNMINLRQKAPLFNVIKSQVEKLVQKNLTKEHIQRILHIAPFMYNHKWEVKFGDTHLVLTVPKNIEEILAGPSCACVSEDHFCG